MPAFSYKTSPCRSWRACCVNTVDIAGMALAQAKCHFTAAVWQSKLSSTPVASAPSITAPIKQTPPTPPPISKNWTALCKLRAVPPASTCSCCHCSTLAHKAYVHTPQTCVGIRTHDHEPDSFCSQNSNFHSNSSAITITLSLILTPTNDRYNPNQGGLLWRARAGTSVLKAWRWRVRSRNELPSLLKRFAAGSEDVL